MSMLGVSSQMRSGSEGGRHRPGPTAPRWPVMHHGGTVRGERCSGLPTRPVCTNSTHSALEDSLRLHELCERTF